MKRTFALCRLWMIGVLLATVSLVTPADAVASFTQVLSFSELGYGDLTATTMFGALEYRLPVPQDTILQEGTALDLVISYSPLLEAGRSTLTVIVNDVSVFSMHLDESSINRGELHIPLPVEDFGDAPNRAAGYTVHLRFYVRSTDSECEEPMNPGLWATVHGDSSLTLVGAPRAPAGDLALLPYPFVVRNARDPAPLTFALTPLPSAGELAAALTMAAYLGQQAPAQLFTFAARLDGQVGPRGKHVAIGFSPDAETPSGPAVISLASNVSDPPTLILAGRSPLLAARAIAQPVLRSQLAGRTAVVRGLGDASLEPSSWPWRRDAATFAQLGADDRTIRGMGDQETYFYFKRPSGWDLTPEKIFLDLHLTPSPQLLPSQSGVQVRVNGHDVGPSLSTKSRRPMDFIGSLYRLIRSTSRATFTTTPT